MEYSNLTADAVEIVEGSTPSLSNQVKLALKQISEGAKTNSKEISRSHLVGTIIYLLDEFGWLKKSVSEDESSDEFDDAIDDSSTQPKETGEKEAEKKNSTPGGGVSSKDSNEVVEVTPKEGNGHENTNPTPETEPSVGGTAPTKDPSKLDNKTTTKGPIEMEDKICRFYAAEKCKFGKSGQNKHGKCKFQHPPKCQKEGCKDWKTCKEMHPVLGDASDVKFRQYWSRLRQQIKPVELLD